MHNARDYDESAALSTIIYPLRNFVIPAIISSMYLKELTLQGFKTFAQKTTLRFLDPTNKTHAVTAIVGPNGSGKSNVADAIRWVLGEQSMKLLRSKSSTDVIFSGSNGKARSGVAEVELTFADVSGIDGIDFSEVRITRKLYRDGESLYSINGASVRLSDIQMFLAQANVGQKSYSVVGQGQIDHILAASPEERKSFFDDATGVKPLQLKRHRASLKLRRTRDNLQQAELLIQEIEPRLRTLRRLVKRLHQREDVEAALNESQIHYYGTLWNNLQSQLKTEFKSFQHIEKTVKEQAGKLEAERATLKDLEGKEKKNKEAPSEELMELQKRYDALQEKRSDIRERLFEAQKQLELAQVRSTSTWTPLPLSQIISRIESVKAATKKIKEQWKKGSLKEKDIDTAFDESKTLLSRLQKPAPESHKPNPKHVENLKAIQKEEAALITELTTLKQALHDSAQSSKNERKEFFALQNRLLAAQDKLHTFESQLNERRVALVRLETRNEDLERDMNEVLAGNVNAARKYKDGADTDSLYQQIQQLRHKLDLIGGIDEETVKEFEETQERFTHLEQQVTDLVGALQETEKLIVELDEQISSQSKQAFASIQTHFEHYFKILFGGGSCSLKEIKARDVQVQPIETEEGEEEIVEKQTKAELDRVIGIDIQATPPGKRLKSINLLSGGERALTSIALISAIMATNPSPFVILDEVDAALDEANTLRFSKILEDLRSLTQFIIITHNRATMHIADVLYGVSMQQDGVSQLLSLQLETAVKNSEKVS